MYIPITVPETYTLNEIKEPELGTRKVFTKKNILRIFAFSFIENTVFRKIK